MAGPNLTIMTGDHDWQVGRFIDSIGEKEKNPERDGDVHIEQDVWIGANVTILKGVTIGESSIVGAGSVVTKNVPPCSIVAGCPAKVIGMKWSEEDIARHRAFLIDGKA